jgi:hypothetical protein
MSRESGKLSQVFIIIEQTNFKMETKFIVSGLNARGIILYLEYQSVNPFVRIDFPPCPTLPKQVGGGRGATLTCGRGGEPIGKTGEKAWHSLYSVG